LSKPRWEQYRGLLILLFWTVVLLGLLAAAYLLFLSEKPSTRGSVTGFRAEKSFTAEGEIPNDSERENLRGATSQGPEILAVKRYFTSAAIAH